MGTFRDFLKSKAGKAQIISEAAWMAALALALRLRSIEALTLLMPIGAGLVIVLMIYAFWAGSRKVKKQ